MAQMLPVAVLQPAALVASAANSTPTGRLDLLTCCAGSASKLAQLPVALEEPSPAAVDQLFPVCRCWSSSITTRLVLAGAAVALIVQRVPMLTFFMIALD